MAWRRTCSPVAAFRSAEHASSLVEFAIICPVLLIFMLMGLELIGYIDATRKVERIAASASEMIAQKAPPTGSTVALVTGTEAHFALDAAIVIFPYLMSDAARQGIAWSQDIEVDIASIQFTQTASTCSDPTNLSACYAPQVLWTSIPGAPNVRQCSPALLPQANSAPTNKLYLPKSVFGPGSLVVVDVYFTYRPSFAARLLPTMTIVRSAYVQPRYATAIKLDMTNTDYMVGYCPGIS